MGWKTDYIGHDQLYRQRKQQGQQGWDDGTAWQAWKTEILVLMSLPDFPKTGKILELGCGAGDVALLFAEKGYRASGIDISPTAIEWARGKALKANIKADFAAGDVQNLGKWEDGCFDVVIDGHCLHCIIGDDRAKVFSETYRVLKPSGLLYVSTMCGDPKEPEVVKQYDTESRCMVGNGIARRYFGKPEDILNEITQTGFSIQQHEVRSNPGTQNDLIVFARK